MKPTNITIIGLGLIGGSLAKALKEKLGFTNLIAIEADLSALELAISEGVIAQGFTSVDKSIYNSDIIFVCTQVKQTTSFINELAPHVREGCIITDVCSTKEKITRYVDSMINPPCFIGGHPMAGTEKSGYSNSFSHLFENAYYALTPCSATCCNSLNTLKYIIEGIGAIPIVMSAPEHDRSAGVISHLPHVIAAALVNIVRGMDSECSTIKHLAAGGFRDLTRIASSSPLMWENIVSSNKEQLADLLPLFIKTLDAFSSKLKADDSEGIYRFFADASDFRDSISSQSPGLLQTMCRLVVDVPDKPGIIGEIATILGQRNINIKNINVTNSREFEQGCLIIALPDILSENIAFDLLMGKGYKVHKIK